MLGAGIGTERREVVGKCFRKFFSERELYFVREIPVVAATSTRKCFFGHLAIWPSGEADRQGTVEIWAQAFMGQL